METFERNFFEMLRLSPLGSGLEMKSYAYQMLRGLQYLHQQGICHRDLKPQNMLVKGRRLVICDFGSAKILRAGEQNISYICSRCYRAPELIFEATNYTTQIDLWSLGCIFLEVLHGRPLFIADSSLNHILEVIKVLGTPTRDDVRAMNPSYEINDYDLPQIKRRPFRTVLFP
jgi:glycogen synthase kinase 3 beta